MSKINFEITSAEIINQNPNSQFATARLRLFSSGANRHEMTCSEDVLKNTAFTAYEKPIIFEVKYGGDFGTHSKDTAPAGFIVKDSAEFVREEDGRLALYVIGKVWKMYSGKFIDIFKSKKTDKAKLSVEMELLEVEDSKSGFLSEMKDFCYSAACILGDMVTEASPGANIKMLSFAYEEAKRNEFEKYGKIDFSIPEQVKKNSILGLDLFKAGSGASAHSVATSRHLIKNASISPEKARSMFQRFSSKKFNSEENSVKLLYGGDESVDWIRSIVESMDLEDRQVKDFSSIDIEQEQIKTEGENFMDEEKEDEVIAEEKKEEEMSAESNFVENEKEKETPDNKEETPDNEEEKQEDMSLGDFDVSACMAMLQDESEEYASIYASKEEGNFNFSKLCGFMYKKFRDMKESMEKMSGDLQSYMSENVSLKEYKASVDAKEFSIAVEKVLADVSKTMPKDEIQKAREDSANYSLETVTDWSNKTRSIAFSFVKEDGKERDGVVRMQLPFNVVNGKGVASPWKR